MEASWHGDSRLHLALPGFETVLGGSWMRWWDFNLEDTSSETLGGDLGACLHSFPHHALRLQPLWVDVAGTCLCISDSYSHSVLRGKAACLIWRVEDEPAFTSVCVCLFLKRLPASNDNAHPQSQLSGGLRRLCNSNLHPVWAVTAHACAFPTSLAKFQS